MSLTDEIDALDKGALFSPCRRWRYLLWRRWEPEQPVCVFVGLNPSTADESVDDPTIRRCIRYAMDWGYGSMWMLNLFAFRATDPQEMRAADLNALGPRNNEYLLQAGRAADLAVAAWGVHGTHMDRERRVLHMFAEAKIDLHALGLSKDGHPRHPLYMRRDLEPFPWSTSYNGIPVLASGV